MSYRRLFILTMAVLLGGCSILDRLVEEERYMKDGGKALVSTKNFNLSPSVTISAETLMFWGAYTSVAYLIIDPFAPNWEIKQAAFPEEHVLINMKMKRVYSGGAGEARQVFQRRAGELMRSGGFNGYQIVEYSESLESSILGSQRVAQGVIKLTHTEG